MDTSTYAIDQLSKTKDIIMVQEHWYFDCQLGKLDTVCEKMAGTGKAVDTGDPILPVQMPRGNGGEASCGESPYIIWSPVYRMEPTVSNVSSCSYEFQS